MCMCSAEIDGRVVTESGVIMDLLEKVVWCGYRARVAYKLCFSLHRHSVI